MDNQLAIVITKNLTFHEQTKHIEVHYHFLKSRVKAKGIELDYILTTEQTVDTMMKVLTQEKHELFAGWMGLRHPG